MAPKTFPKIDFVDPHINDEKSEEAFIHGLDMLYERGLAAQRRYESTMLGNFAAASGRPFDMAAELRAARRCDVRLPPGAERRDWIGVAIPHLRKGASTLVSSTARHEGKPNNETPIAKMQANITTAYLNHYYNLHRESYLQFNEAMLKCICGHCVRRTLWNPYGGVDGLTGYIEIRKDGELESRTLDFFHYILPPWHNSTQWPPSWFITHDVFSIEQVREIFGRAVPAEEVSTVMAKVDQLLAGIVNPEAPYNDGHSVQRDQSVIVKELFLPPSIKEPRGRRIAWANKVILADTELPGGIFPFIDLAFWPFPRAMYGFSMIGAAANLQSFYNQLKRNIREIMAARIRGDIVQHGEGEVRVNVDEKTGHKTFMVGDGVRDFEIMTYPVDTRLAEYDLMQTMETMEDIMGVHKPSLGKASHPNETLGQTLMQKQGDDDSLGPIIVIHNMQQELIAAQKIHQGKEHLLLPREIEGMDKYTMLGSNFFTGPMMGRTSRVRPVATPTLSVNEERAIEQQFELAGLYGPWPTPAHQFAIKCAFIHSGVTNAIEKVDSFGIPMADLQAGVDSASRIDMAVYLLMKKMTLAQLMAPQISAMTSGPVDMSAEELKQFILSGGDPKLMAAGSLPPGNPAIPQQIQ